MAAVAALCALPRLAVAQRPGEVAPNAPADRPIGTTQRCQLEAMHRATAPYIRQALATYPDAKRRFLAGLPAHHTFFVTTRLHDARGREEQVFVAVDSIRSGRVSGRLSSAVAVLAGYRLGQAMTVPESDIIDWMVARPDGTEEGNVVGNFLDSYVPPAACTDSGRAG